MAYIWFLFICLMWGSSFILMKKASLALSPVEIGAWRVISGAAALGILCWWNRSLRLPRGMEWGWLLFIAIVGYAWPYVLQPYLVALHGSGFVGITVSFVPLLTIAVSVPVLGFYPTFRQLIGVLGALVCMVILVWDGRRREIPVADMLLAGTVPLGYAVCNTFIRRWLSQVESLPLTFQALVISGSILLPLTATTIVPQPSFRSDWFIAISSLAILGILGTGVATWLFNKLIHEQGPLFAGMVTNLVPIGAVLWGWADGEQVTGPQVAALIGIVVMVSIVQFGAARRATSGGPIEPGEHPAA